MVARRTRSTARSLGVLGFVLCLVAASSCTVVPFGAGLSSAQLYAAGSPSLRTVDNAGYVGPAGLAQPYSVSAGMQPYYYWSGDGVRPPAREYSYLGGSMRERASPGETRKERTSETATSPAKARSLASVDPSELAARVARALCDRETYCDRIGADRAFESADACIAVQRERVGRFLGAPPCREFPGERVSSCLKTIRLGSCAPPQDPAQTESACAAAVLCDIP
jgi:hypothetical protein